jgi:hypothetical protein
MNPPPNGLSPPLSCAEMASAASAYAAFHERASERILPSFLASTVPPLLAERRNTAGSVISSQKERILSIIDAALAVIAEDIDLCLEQEDAMSTASPVSKQ